MTKISGSAPLRFFADEKPTFSVAFRLLNVDKYYFPIRITNKLQLQVAKNVEVSEHEEKNKTKYRLGI